METKKIFSLYAAGFTDELFYCLLQFYESLKITVKSFFFFFFDCPSNHNKKKGINFLCFLDWGIQKPTDDF